MGLPRLFRARRIVLWCALDASRRRMAGSVPCSGARRGRDLWGHIRRNGVRCRSFSLAVASLETDHVRLTPVTLSGSIVRLEPLRGEHASELAAVGLDPALWRLQPSMVDSLEDMEAYVASGLRDQEQGLSLCFVIVSQRTGTVIGTTRFMDIALVHKRLEIGATWITSAHQRTGANVEAKLLLLAHAFDVVGVQKVVLKTETLNEQSRRAILALGATEEGTLRRQFLADTGRPRDMVYFSVFDDEWPAVRDRLLGRLARFS